MTCNSEGLLELWGRGRGQAPEVAGLRMGLICSTVGREAPAAGRDRGRSRSRIRAKAAWLAAICCSTRGLGQQNAISSHTGVGCRFFRGCFFFFFPKKMCPTFLAFCQDDVKGKQFCWSGNQTQRFLFSGSLQGLLEKNFPSHSSSFFLPGRKQKMQRGFQETFLSLGCSQRNTTIFHMEEI